MQEKENVYLASIFVEGPQRETTLAVVAKDIQEVEDKTKGKIIRLKKMPWIPSPSVIELEDTSRWFLVETKSMQEAPDLTFLVRATNLADTAIVLEDLKGYSIDEIQAFEFEVI